MPPALGVQRPAVGGVLVGEDGPGSRRAVSAATDRSVTMSPVFTPSTVAADRRSHTRARRPLASTITPSDPAPSAANARDPDGAVTAWRRAGLHVELRPERRPARRVLGPAPPAARCRSRPPTAPRPRALRSPRRQARRREPDQVGGIDVVARGRRGPPRGTGRAAAGAKTSRPSKVAASRAAAGAGQRHGRGRHRPRVSMAQASSPLSGPTKMQRRLARRGGVPPTTATARRAVPTPGSTTARTTPGPRCGTARASARAPARTSKGATPWVRSTIGAPGAQRRTTGPYHAGEFVAEPVVGEEEDRPTGARSPPAPLAAKRPAGVSQPGCTGRPGTGSRRPHAGETTSRRAPPADLRR